jgi:hypothetical protein
VPEVVISGNRQRCQFPTINVPQMADRFVEVRGRAVRHKIAGNRQDVRLELGDQFQSRPQVVIVDHRADVKIADLNQRLPAQRVRQISNRQRSSHDLNPVRLNPAGVDGRSGTRTEQPESRRLENSPPSPA